MSTRILLVEDEPGLLLTVTDLLETEGYQVQTAQDGADGLQRALSGQYGLMILDVMLPKKSGFDVCRELRQAGNDLPLLMLTAKTQVIDRVVGLKLGADDYLSKPFDPSELLARIEALLRRAHRDDRTPLRNFEFGNVAVDFETGEVYRSGLNVNLAGKELQLLRYLVENRGKVVPREELLQNVWEYQSEVTSRTVDVHIAWLRQKVEKTPQTPRYIQTIRGKGYRFVA